MASEQIGTDALALADRYSGAVLRKVSRLFYLFEGSLDRSDGELQLEFVDGRVLFLTGDSTGELVQARSDSWRDSFAEPLSLENEDYLESHGRAVMTDVSGDAEFRSIIGRALQSVYPLTNKFGRTIGMQLGFEKCLLNFFVSGDECLVTWGRAGVPKWSDAPP
jgi:hypothetical protein